MSAVAELISALERVGGCLALEGGRVEVAYPEDKKNVVEPIVNGLRAHRDEVAHFLREQVTSTPVPAKPQAIPAGAVLLAPRCDSKPVERVPQCWCCSTPYALDWVQHWQGKKYAHLQPGCGCLDTAQAIKCCGLCLEHCDCKKRQKGNYCPEVSSK